MRPDKPKNQAQRLAAIEETLRELAEEKKSKKKKAEGSENILQQVTSWVQNNWPEIAITAIAVHILTIYLVRIGKIG